jgi:trimeric autotransporter adhesin
MFRISVCACAYAIFLLACCVVPVNAQQPVAASANVAVPPMVNFSGVLTDVNGKPLTGTVGVTFYLYKESQGGAPLWMETQNVQADKAGHYTAALGSTTSQGLPAAVFASGEARWLGVQVQGQAEQPRVLLMSVPYALKALDAETIGGKPISSFMLAPTSSDSSGKGAAPPGTITGNGTEHFIPMFTGTTTIGNSKIFQTVGLNVGIGTTTPTAKLDVNGTSNVRDTLTLFPKLTHPTLSVKGTDFAVSRTGIVTFVAGQTFPGTGTVSSVGSGAGLTGGPITTTGTRSIKTGGVTNVMLANPSLTVAAGTDLTGGGVVALGGTTTLKLDTTKVPGLKTANTFTGNQTVIGNLSATNEVSAGRTPTGNVASGTVEVDAATINSGSWSPALTFGGGGEVIASDRRGTTNQFGLDFFTNYTPRMSITNAGLVAIGRQNPTIMFEVWAPSDSSLDGAVIFGAPETGKGFAAGNGLFGTGGDDTSNIVDNGAGVGGGFNGGNSTIGFGGDGVDSLAGSGPLGNGYAGFFAGDVDVTGAIFAGVKDFKIDHPLDPANKYLVHSSVESSEMMNIYAGNVTTDAGGEAVVELPQWFEALNTDFRYQLTVIGQFAQAIVAREIQDHRFTIRTNAPSVKVSWQVTAVRQDAYAKAHPLVVEEEKDARLRGFYIHPGLYGAPEEKSVEWARHPEMMRQMKARQAKLAAQSTHR